MKIIISPAKKLDFEIEDYPIESTEIEFAAQSEKLISKLKKLKPKQIAELMDLSPALADLNFERYQNWKYPFDDSQTKPAVFAFDGEVYTGLDIRSFTKEELSRCQEQLMILSGLYGVLRPMDRILPYRLEMGTSLEYSATKKNLYQFWGDGLTKKIVSQLDKDEVLVNLASVEYSKVLDFRKIKNQIVTPIFKEKKGNDYKVVMVFAKQARGLMSQFIIKNNIDSVDGIKTFDWANYQISESLSKNGELVFVR
jgi:cytoplasmic iron level regulating protein YaaA (DUF328/UPF0246 family)